MYRKLEAGDSSRCSAEPPELEKESLSCYTGASCDTTTSDMVTIQPSPMLVSIGSAKIILHIFFSTH